METSYLKKVEREMNKFILDHEIVIRLGFFLGILILMGLWEMVSPRRLLSTSKRARWFCNLGLLIIDTAVLRVVLPVAAVGVAIFVEDRSWGILNNIALPYWMAILFGVIGLDFVIYLQHAMFHAIPAFWRLHMMHHTDLDFDVTTGVRFHPIEILLSMVIKIAAVMVMGASAMAVLIFEVLLNATSLFNHGNVRLPSHVDWVLRLFVVTPEMHRVHHSVVIRETNSNFGFNLPWWDRLLGTYRDQPAAGHEGMTIGLSHFRDPNALTLPFLLILPFIRKPGKYSFSG
jgi:sterol desaturase/sphingolipid hydroxylase (fatty acid hydroxylase superfamily)